MIALKPCPCGKVPDVLSVQEGSTFRWRIVDGACCGIWCMEIRVPTLDVPDDYDEYDYCCEEWNAAPRATGEGK